MAMRWCYAITSNEQHTARHVQQTKTSSKRTPSNKQQEKLTMTKHAMRQHITNTTITTITINNNNDDDNNDNSSNNNLTKKCFGRGAATTN